MKKKLLLPAVIFFAVTAAGFSAVSFDNLNINPDSMALFTVKNDSNGAKSYSALYAVDLSVTGTVTNNNPPAVLTCYPESLEIFQNGKVLQIKNCYGTASYNFEEQKLTWLARTGLLPDDKTISGPVVASPDGKWCVFLRKITPSYGELIIENTVTRQYVILDSKASYSYTKVPVKWSYDSRKIIYEKNGFLFFCQPEYLFAQVQVAEKYRRIGRGKIDSIQWCTDDTLLYIDSDIIYRIDSHELSALGLYAGIMNPGKIAGRLPQKFTGGHDVFYANPESSQLIIIRDNNAVSYYSINKNTNSAFVEIQDSKSFKDIYANTFSFDVYWSAGKKPVIWAQMIDNTAKKTAGIYCCDSAGKIQKIIDISEYDAKPALSPDGNILAVAGKNSLMLFDTNTWTTISALPCETTTSLVWKDNANLIVGGVQTVRQWNLKDTAQVLFLSSAQNCFWDSVTGNIAVKVSGYENYFLYNAKNNTWKAAPGVIPNKKCVQNEYYRIYTAESANDRFKNALWVRNLKGKTSTTAMFKETSVNTPSKKKIALIFDAVDNADGINSIIAVCKAYGLECTFFINGEFIRRYPQETRLIAASGFECASMFYTTVDLTGKEFDFDDEYILAGLARNEDEFFACTGKELCLLWHAPYYKATKKIKEAGFKAGYSYIDFPTDPQSIDSKAGKTLESQIIPVTTGFSYNSLDEKFEEKLEMLINTLLDSDYQIVPVSKL